MKVLPQTFRALDKKPQAKLHIHIIKFEEMDATILKLWSHTYSYVYLASYKQGYAYAT